MVEVIEGTKEYAREDVEAKKMVGEKILDERGSDDGPLDSSALAHYEKLVPETTNETEIALPCCKQGKKDDSKLHTNFEHDYRDKKHSVETYKMFRACFSYALRLKRSGC